MVKADRQQVTKVVESILERMFEGGPMTPGVAEEEARFEAVPIPFGIIEGTPATVDELRAAIEGIDARWRLDAVLALEDYLD